MLTQGDHPFKTGENNSNKQVQDAILNTEIPMKKHFSKEAISVIRGLTEKDENMRLGANGTEGMNALKTHPFFKGIDWKKLSKKEVKSPFPPPVRSNSDYTLIDPEFLNEDITNSSHDQPETKIEKSAGAEAEIPNFQFINPKVLNDYQEKQERALSLR